MVVDHPVGWHGGEEFFVAGLDKLFVPFLTQFGDLPRLRVVGGVVIDVVTSGDEKIGFGFEDGGKSGVTEIFVGAGIGVGQLGIVFQQVLGFINAVVTVEFGVVHAGDDDKTNGLVGFGSRQGFESGSGAVAEMIFVDTDPGFALVWGPGFELVELNPGDEIVFSFCFGDEGLFFFTDDSELHDAALAGQIMIGELIAFGETDLKQGGVRCDFSDHDALPRFHSGFGGGWL